jgi:hypothetical protein
MRNAKAILYYVVVGSLAVAVALVANIYLPDDRDDLHVVYFVGSDI